jgi:hypothetical protein
LYSVVRFSTGLELLDGTTRIVAFFLPTMIPLIFDEFSQIFVPDACLKLYVDLLSFRPVANTVNNFTIQTGDVLDSGFNTGSYLMP